MAFIAISCAFLMGGNFIKIWLSSLDETVFNLDEHIYADILVKLDAFYGDISYLFVWCDSCIATL
jgi:hypothetical protein